MNYLRCIPVLILFIFATSAFSQKNDKPTRHSIKNVVFKQTNQVMTSQDPTNCPDHGVIIIIPPNHTANSAKNCEMAISAFKHYTVTFEGSHKDVFYYWTLWIDFNDNNKIDVSNGEIFRTKGRGSKTKSFYVKNGSLESVKFGIYMSDSGYHHPSNPKFNGEYIVSNMILEVIDWADKHSSIDSQKTLDVDYDVFPNPASNLINLRIKDELSKTATIQLFNSAGMNVMSQHVKLYRGQAKTSLVVDSLVRGVYHLQIVTETQSKMETIVLH